MTMKYASINRYLSLDYSTITYKEKYGGQEYFVAEIPELKGCSAHGATIAEALKELKEAKKAWLESAIKNGEAIPLPESYDDFSGKLIVRIPPKLHKQARIVADRKNISLNSLIKYAIGKDLSNQADDIQIKAELMLLKEKIEEVTVAVQGISHLLEQMKQEMPVKIPLVKPLQQDKYSLGSDLIATYMRSITGGSTHYLRQSPKWQTFGVERISEEEQNIVGGVEWKK